MKNNMIVFNYNQSKTEEKTSDKLIECRKPEKNVYSAWPRVLKDIDRLYKLDRYFFLHKMKFTIE